jgi:hypothetical protein
MDRSHGDDWGGKVRFSITKKAKNI